MKGLIIIAVVSGLVIIGPYFLEKRNIQKTVNYVKEKKVPVATNTQGLLVIDKIF